MNVKPATPDRGKGTEPGPVKKIHNGGRRNAVDGIQDLSLRRFDMWRCLIEWLDPLKKWRLSISRLVVIPRCAAISH
jgi:hypothetical protein